jgi:hypothetical protein
VDKPWEIQVADDVFFILQNDQVDDSSFSEGIYFLNIQTTNKVLTLKFAKIE